MKIKRLFFLVFLMILITTGAFGEITTSDVSMDRARRLAQAIMEISMAYHGKFVDSAVASLNDADPTIRPKWPLTNTIRQILPKNVSGNTMLSIREEGLGASREEDGWLFVTPDQSYASVGETRMASKLLPLGRYDEGTNEIRVPLIRPAASSTLAYIMEYVKVILLKRDGLGIDETTGTPTFHAGSSMILGDGGTLRLQDTQGIRFLVSNAEIEGVSILSRNAGTNISFQNGLVDIRGNLRVTGALNLSNAQFTGNVSTSANVVANSATVSGNVNLVPQNTAVTLGGNAATTGTTIGSSGSLSIEGQLRSDGSVTATTSAAFTSRPSVGGKSGAGSSTAWNKYVTNAVTAQTADVMAVDTTFSSFALGVKDQMYCYYTKTPQTCYNYVTEYRSATCTRQETETILKMCMGTQEVTEDSTCYRKERVMPARQECKDNESSNGDGGAGPVCHTIIEYADVPYSCTITVKQPYTYDCSETKTITVPYDCMKPYTVAVPYVCYTYSNNTCPASYVDDMSRCSYAGNNKYRCKLHLQ